MGTLSPIGKLNQQVRFERLTTTDDPVYGPQPSTWTTVCTVWANVQDVLPSRAETAASGIRIESRPARIRCRYRTDITSAMRVVLVAGGRVLKIVAGPAEIGFRRGIEIMAEEFTTAGDTT